MVKIKHTRLKFSPAHTQAGEVVHQYELGEQVRRRSVQHRVDRAEQRRPGLVVEADDDRRVRQAAAEVSLATPAGRRNTVFLLFVKLM